MKPKPWLRLYTDIIDDEKLGLLAFEDRWHYIALLACKRRGLLDRDEPDELMRRKIALKLGLATRELDEVVRRLSEVGLVERESMQPCGWDERQFVSDSSTERVRAYRERQAGRKNDGNDDETFQKRPKNTDTETDKDKEKNTGRAKRQPAAPLQLPDCIPMESWTSWLAYRRERRLSTVQATLNGQMNKLAGWHKQGYDPASIIQESIDNGWQGLFLPKGASKPRPLSRHSGFDNRNYGKGVGDDGSF